MTEKRLPDPNLVHRAATGYMGTCVLLAALELNVLDEISGKALTAGQVAEALHLEPNPVERLLVALTALGLVVRKQETYTCSLEAERYLVKSSPSYFGDYYRFQVRQCLLPDFVRLDELIRQDRAVMADSWSAFMDDPEKARVFSMGQHSASQGGGRMLARVYDFSPHRKMVDLAGGSGACSIAACRSNPRLRSVIVDFPNVLTVTEEMIAKAGLADRITTQPGDIGKDDWPEADMILLSLVISAFSDAGQSAIFRKCFDRLCSGGTILVHDFLMDDDYSGPLLSGLYNLTSVEGTPKSRGDMTRLLEQAGFVEPSIKTVIPHYTAMVAARKP